MVSDLVALDLPLPDSFKRRISAVFGLAGDEWLRNLPDLLRELAAAWSLELLSPFDLSYNYVVPVLRADGSEAVLKVGVPNPELITEIEALRLYAGVGAARLLENDAERGALLMERVRPGMPLAVLQDDQEATRIAAETMQRVWRPVPENGSPFPTVRRWANSLYTLRTRLAGGTGPIPPAMVDRAIGIFDEMIVSSAPPVLLHADLHHWNILWSDRADTWLAIDPKGVSGEPAYEVGAFLHNPIPDVAKWPNARKVHARRAAQFSELLGLDRKRLIAWSYAQAVLSACWDLEEEGEGRIWLDVAEICDDVPVWR